MQTEKSFQVLLLLLIEDIQYKHLHYLLFMKSYKQNWNIILNYPNIHGSSNILFHQQDVCLLRFVCSMLGKGINIFCNCGDSLLKGNESPTKTQKHIQVYNCDQLVVPTPMKKYARRIGFHFPNVWVENNQYLKPPSSFVDMTYWIQIIISN